MGNSSVAIQNWRNVALNKSQSRLLHEWRNDHNCDHCAPEPSSQELVTEFHETFEHPVNRPGLINNIDFIKLRDTLIKEEGKELSEELWQCAQEGTIRSNLLKEIGDLRYVLSGLCVALGIDEEECVRRVHDSNMSKLGEDGKPIYREDGKVLKGPKYKEPDMTDLVP
jgi:uncharacterized protein YabN with tetrapyrrole methylase and pyrophosphatase domain